MIIRGGIVYDGTGAAGRRVDVGVRGDRIAAVGDLQAASATRTVDASGLAVAPGFINMLSGSTRSLLVDGRSQSEVRQGVTTQIFGDGNSMGPLSPEMKTRAREQMGDLKYEHHLDYARGVLAGARAPRDFAKRGLLCWRNHHPRACDRSRQQKANRGGARSNARSRAARNGSGCAGRLVRADLRAWHLREYRGTDRAVQGGGEVSREVHLASAQRRRPAAGSHRRADSDQQGSGPARRDLSPQGGGTGELAEDGAGNRERSRRRAAED